jgi:hypothetical protein
VREYLERLAEIVHTAAAAATTTTAAAATVIEARGKSRIGFKETFLRDAFNVFKIGCLIVYDLVWSICRFAKARMVDHGNTDRSVLFFFELHLMARDLVQRESM